MRQRQAEKQQTESTKPGRGCVTGNQTPFKENGCWTYSWEIIPKPEFRQLRG